MKKLMSSFADKLLSNQQLRTVKGGNYYCTCGNGGGPFNAASAQDCHVQCWGPNGGGGHQVAAPSGQGISIYGD